MKEESSSAGVLLLGDYDVGTVRRLKERYRLLHLLHEAGLTSDALAFEPAAVVLRSPFRLGDREFAHFHRLRAVIRAGSGVDGIDLAEAERRGVRVYRAPLARRSVAELGFAFMLIQNRRLLQLSQQLSAEGRWLHFCAGHELSQQEILVVGFGNIGRELAMLLHGFGSRILVADPSRAHVKTQHAARCGAVFVPLQDGLAAADHVVLCCSFNPETAGLMCTRTLELMKPGAHLVNLARGGIVDEHAVEEYLNSGRLAGYSTDVFSEEPVAPGHHLLRNRKVMATPHVGAQTFEAKALIGREVERLLDSILSRSHDDA